MKISMVMLSYNRGRMLEKVTDINLASAGDVIDEFIWVDNASTDDTRKIFPKYNPDVSILNKTNLGLAIALNRGLVCATGDAILINEGDIIFPSGWLVMIKKYLEGIEMTGCLSIPNQGNVDWNNTPVTEINGLPVCVQDIAIGATVRTRRLMKYVGYYHQDLGLYGQEDRVWNNFANNIRETTGLIHYMIPGFEGIHQLCSFANIDTPEGYDELKNREAFNPEKLKFVETLVGKGGKYYNPFLWM